MDNIKLEERLDRIERLLVSRKSHSRLMKLVTIQAFQGATYIN